ncbi:hypothetical protein TRICI_005720 [Trichomonascus ciferrii]|uniref:Zn(2)-C6 fungal-type domain-containing protein n=1 Tax=Trichomonascus ciferrii TaxID=44093 RepID=A0A642UQG9_9ASCO|nr:hypothetical protein TRICI_005720 [Trichomonascus ciferrii]
MQGEGLQFVGRKHTRQACQACRELKRKCDGNQPCGACVRFEYECFYVNETSKRRRKENGKSVSPVVGETQEFVPNLVENPAPSTSCLRSLEANSGTAFVRRLALRLDPKNAPRMDSFAWNAFLGARRAGRSPTSRSITDMLTKINMCALSAVYLDKMHPVYGFIDRGKLERQIENRWSGDDDQAHDAVLCGVAAIGCLFSQVEASDLEADLVETARLKLVNTIADIPSETTITAWMLRVVYLRCAETHHTAWMASCILMHMVEAAGLHCEPTDESVLTLPQEHIDPEHRRRLFAVAQHLNIWTSFDMGRSRVSLYNASTIMPSPRQGDCTTELMRLLPSSAELDPDKTHDASELESTLIEVLNGVHSCAPSILAQCNLTLCLCRRLQSLNACFKRTTLEQILNVTAKGIQAAQTILDNRAPWHHMANIPFQIICILLSIDTISSIAQIKDAMQVLRNITLVYNTEATREALNTASLLILLQQRRKERGVSDLSNILKDYPVVSTQSNDQPTSQQLEGARWLNSIANDLSTIDYSDFDRILFPGLFHNGL